MDHLTRFLNTIRDTPALQEKLKPLENKPAEEQIAGLKALSDEAGTPISTEEWNTAHAAGALTGIFSTLSDKHLSEISGGYRVQYMPH